MYRLLSRPTAIGALTLLLAACRAEAPPSNQGKQQGSQPAAGIADDRTPIALPAAARAQVIQEMHSMMEALQGMLANLPLEDTEAFAAAAEGGGTQIAVDRDPNLGEALPQTFASLGMSTHSSFDRVAAAAREGAPLDTITAQMARLTQKCNRCHSQYKLVAK